MSDTLILTQLNHALPEILPRITASHLRRYDTLQKALHTINVAVDPSYQRMFNGFYRMQRRREDWYAYFFALLEKEKANPVVTFEYVFRKVYAETGRVEPSFCSKLVATVRPDMPVYDRYVRENLSLAIPKPQERPDRRVAGFTSTYGTLHTRLNELVRSEDFSAPRTAFDETFPTYAHFTDMKKLDLLLWQHRKV